MTTAHSAKQSMSTDSMFRGGTQTPLGISDIKPKLLEQRVTENETFFRLSDGYKKIFVNDKKDEKMVIPIVGYGGHRRGDRSQNYFGKSFRDVTIQAKRLERSQNPQAIRS